MLQEIIQTLQNLGFTKLEAKIFTKLLYLGEATASTLSKELKIHRRSAYDTVERLVKKGFVGFIVKDNKKYYYPIIEKVKDLIEDQKEKILNAEKVYSKILKGFIKSNTTKAFLLYGKEGIKQMFLNELNSKTDIYVICNDIERTENLLGDLFLKKFTHERIKREIKINMLTSKKVNLFWKNMISLRFEYFLLNLLLLQVFHRI